MTGKKIVFGEIVLPPTGLPSNAASVVVRVEDISRADAPAIVVGEQRQDAVRLHPSATLPFRVEVPTEQLNERALYSVSAHIDTSGSGRVDRGDLVSTETYPVLTRGYGTEVRVRVKPV
jgi:uncharacterized lipoprotein YbaY